MAMTTHRKPAHAKKPRSLRVSTAFFFLIERTAKGMSSTPPTRKRRQVICMGANTPCTVLSMTSIVLKITAQRTIKI